MGAWLFVMPRLQFILDAIKCANDRPIFVGRKATASTASGSMAKHLEEQLLLVEQALSWSLADLQQPFRRATPLGSLAQPSE